MDDKVRATLVRVSNKALLAWEIDEMYNLASTAGYEIIAHVTQVRQTEDSRYSLGSGKLSELISVARDTKSEVIIFGSNLTGTQFNNLESKLNIEVLDRTMLIIDIFSKHAISNEGKLQVELMYKKKMLPRIMGQGKHMSQQGGGGTGGGGARRGIGEKKTELDRRTIRTEIRDLEKRIDKLAKERNLRRNKRTRNQIKNVSLVGYTNAGKSTIMNALTNADTLVKDALFATLDPISRKLFFNDGSMALLTDTVGFISNLPHEFVKAFRSTLEETVFSDLILHIVDGSSPVSHEQFNVVNSVLDSIGVKDTPIITVINKADKDIFEFIPRSKHMVVVSAKTGQNIDKLKKLIHKLLFVNNLDNADDTV